MATSDVATVKAAPVIHEKVTEAGQPSDASSVQPKDDKKKEAPPSLETKPDSSTEVGHEDEEKQTEHVTGVKLWAVFSAVTVVAFLILMDMSVIVTATPRITTVFNSLPDIGWYASAYNLCSAALQPFSGKLYLYFKSRWLFLGFLFLFELGSLICGVAQSSTMLIIGRAVAGMGAAGLINGGLTIVSAAAPMEKRPMLLGLFMGLCQLGLVMGPLVGGALTQYATWRWCFYINLPIGAVAAAVMVFIHVPDQSVRPSGTLINIILTKLDLIGFALFAPSIIMLLLALQYGGNEFPWDSPTVIGLFCGAAVGLVIFVFWERREGDEAMVPMTLLKKRIIWTACLMQLFLFSTIFMAAYYLSIYFQSVKNDTPFQAGVNILPNVLPQIIFAGLGGFLTQKFGYYLPFGVLGAIIVSIGNGLISTWNPSTRTATWAGHQVLLGAGRGIAMQVSLVASQAAAPANLVPIVSAMVVFSQQIGGAIFIAAVNALFGEKLRSELRANLPDADVQTIIDAGARGIRVVVGPEDVGKVVDAYSKGLNVVFYFIAGLGVAMFVSSLGIGWVDIRKKKPAAAEESPA